MGQTLTHGVYLPDEGERNCYNGLAANWQLLDTSVGTIAEHTTALSGKAPLVHTHGNITNDGKVGTTANKPLITGTGGVVQAGSFGNAANTFCEGNDSRLSDARTPVAHTHTKSDITNLFNSANTWSANNIFSAGAYFYNSDSTAATSTLNLRNSKVTKGGTSDSGSQIIQFLDKDNKFLSQITTNKALSGTTQLQFTLGNIDSNNNSIAGSIVYSLAIDGTKQFIPGSNNTHDLGNSSYQWNNLYANKVNTQSLNGINPGALSLPDNSGYTNISGNITNLTGSVNSYTPPSDGYVMVNVNPDSNNYAYVSLERITVRSSSETTSGKNAMATIPVIGGKSIDISVIGASIAQARFTPCLGNV